MASRALLHALHIVEKLATGLMPIPSSCKTWVPDLLVVLVCTPLSVVSVCICCLLCSPYPVRQVLRWPRGVLEPSHSTSFALFRADLCPS